MAVARPLGLEKVGGGRRQQGVPIVIPLVVKSPALESSWNPTSATFWLCNMGSVTSFMGLSFLSCKMGIIIVPSS